MLLIIERLFLGKLLKKNPVKIINWIYTIFAVMIGWVYFRSNTIFQANEFVRQLFTFGESKYSVFSYLSMEAIVVIIFAIFFSGFVQRPVKALIDKKTTSLVAQGKSIPQIAITAVQATSFVLEAVIVGMSVLALTGGTYNAFIYFQF